MFSVTEPPRGAPSGAAEFIVSGGMGVSTPIIISQGFDFHGKTYIFLTLLGTCKHAPSAGASPKSDSNVVIKRALPLRCLPLFR